MNSDLAKKVFDVAHLRGEFLLRSGKTSNKYFDKYQFEARPEILNDIADAMIPLLPEDFDLLGAMEMGGIPIATAIALKTGREMVFVRKEAKEYGTCKFAEGPNVKGKKICIIEDVITTGGAVITSTKMLREKGGRDLKGAFGDRSKPGQSHKTRRNWPRSHLSLYDGAT